MPHYTARKALQSTVPTQHTETRSHDLQSATRVIVYLRRSNPNMLQVVETFSTLMNSATVVRA
jgi:hypothetical protein